MECVGDLLLVQMKRCSRCGEVKLVTEFNSKLKSRDRRDPACRDCHRAYNRSHYERHRAVYIANARRYRLAYLSVAIRQLWNYLSAHPCVDCGASNPLVLEFDHRDPRTKKLAVSRLLDDGRWKQVEAEIAKCDVRCANCHRIRTAKQFGWRKAALAEDAAAK